MTVSMPPCRICGMSPDFCDSDDHDYAPLPVGETIMSLKDSIPTRDPGSTSPFGKPITGCKLYQVMTGNYARGNPVPWPEAVTRAERLSAAPVITAEIKIVGVQYLHRSGGMNTLTGGHEPTAFFAAQQGAVPLGEKLAAEEFIRSFDRGTLPKATPKDPRDVKINITVTIWEGKYRADLAIVPWRHFSSHEDFADARGMLAVLRDRTARTLAEKPGERVAEILVWAEQGGTSGHYRDQVTVDNFDAAEAALKSQRDEIAKLGAS